MPIVEEPLYESAAKAAPDTTAVPAAIATMNDRIFFTIDYSLIKFVLAISRQNNASAMPAMLLLEKTAGTRYILKQND